MTSLAERFLSEPVRQKIREAVREAEKRTSGEILPLVVSTSYDYPVADMIAGLVFGLPAALALDYFLAGRLWLNDPHHLFFLGLLAFCFLFFHQICGRIPPVKRWFISQREMAEEVEEAAAIQFLEEGLHTTRDGTGVLIFISVFERRVRVLADHGISEKIPREQWDRIVHIITDGIKQGNQAEGVRMAVREAGQMLETHFPVRTDDTNELADLRIKS